MWLASKLVDHSTLALSGRVVKRVVLSNVFNFKKEDSHYTVDFNKREIYFKQEGCF